MRSESEIKKEIEDITEFNKKYYGFFNDEGIAFHRGKIKALQWVIENG